MMRFVKRGGPWIWITGGALGLTLLGIAGLVVLVAWQGLSTFWPRPLVAYELEGGERVVAALHDVGEGPEGRAQLQLHLGNRDVQGLDFRWVDEASVTDRSRPEWAVVVERLEWGPFHGFVKEVREGDRVVASGHQAAFEALEARLPAARDRLDAQREMELDEATALAREEETARLELKRLRAAGRPDDAPEVLRARAAIESAQARFATLQARLDEARAADRRHEVTLETAMGRELVLPVSSVVRVFAPNRLGLPGKLGVYLSRAAEFVAGEPREANTEGGVWPAIFGTVLMTLIMTLAVVPLGVITAVYLREYARQGPLVSAVRIAVNNLAGVPSIVFGVFGLGFFVYIVGGGIDRMFYPERLPTPTFGTGGILWASLTLALLTVPVVVVSTEEALAAVPTGVREGALGCGATKWQTITRVVLPGAVPGILTGTILAVARGAGEVAPLMLTGVVKMAPALPLDGQFPFLHLERKFMHLGFHIYDVGFQSPNVEAARPMVFSTALLLLAIVLALNLTAILVRNRLQEKYRSSAF